MSTTFSIKRNGNVLWRKFPIGHIDYETYQVTDVRGKAVTYANRLECMRHFTQFVGWREYVNCRPKTALRVRYAETETYKRWSMV
jgi:hypothetical protein